MEKLSMFLLIVFEVTCIIAAVTLCAWCIIDDILTSLRNGESKEQKHYKRLKRTLQKSIQKIGSKDTVENLRIALFCVDGLEELRKELIKGEEFEEKNFGLKLELGEKNMKIARLEDEIKKMEMARLGEVAEKAKSEKRGKGKK